MEYDWAFSPMSEFNFNRLVGIDYPARVEGDGRRELAYDYGDNAGGADSVLGRITSISEPGLGQLAAYDYIGSSRRLSTLLGYYVSQSFYSPADGYSGWDRFGRVQDLEFHGPTDGLIHRYEYGYDKAGNRTFARISQYPETVGGTDTVGHSWLYAYDNLSRLISATHGWLTADNSGIDPAGPEPGSITWSLDGLGNWSGDPAGAGSVVWQTGGEVTQQIHHVVNSRNEIEELQIDGAGTDFLYDAAGNLVFDGELVYQYDAWGRLLQVNLPGSVTFDADGRIASGLLGDLKFRYVHDGLGRLIRKETPLTSGTTSLQIKDLYYDGVRRIQEVIFRPDVRDVGVSEEFTVEQGDGSEYVEIESGVNDEAARTTSEDGGEPEIGEQDVNRIGLGQSTAQTWTDREYVYGPGYVDEFVCQIDRNDAVLFMLQDANYNVVGLVAGTGVTDRNGDVVPPGTLLEQYTWEPYGGLVATQYFNAAGQLTTTWAHAVNRVGHQGLFFDRLDAGETDPVLAPGASGLYYNRNRFYSPSLGRFLQRDPNETGLAILTALASNAESIQILLSGFDPRALYAGGMNLYEFAGSNPVNGRDPLGLEYDDFDAAIDDHIATYVAALGYIQSASGFALLGTNMAVDILGGLLGADLIEAGKKIFEGQGGFWDYVEVGLTVAGAAKVAFKAFKWGKQYLKNGKVAANSGMFKKFCNCFVAGTCVQTPEGCVPIECVQEGDEVITRDQDQPSQTAKVGQVTRVFRSIAPAIMWLSLANGAVLGATPGHEVWTHQDGWTLAERLEVGDTFADQQGAPVEIIDIRIDPGPTPVYNLEVDGAFTYFAEGVWVHNNSCPLGRKLLDRHHALPKFLRGHADGYLVGLKPEFHTEFHSALYQRLSAAGLKLSGKKGDNWEKLLRVDNNAEIALDVLLDTCRDFDAKHSTSLVQTVWAQIARQMW